MRILGSPMAHGIVRSDDGPMRRALAARLPALVLVDDVVLQGPDDTALQMARR
jgi:hypothetical protein